MVTTNQKPLIGAHTHTHTRKKFKHNINNSYQITRKGIKRRKEHKEQQKQPQSNQMLVSIHLLIIMLNLNGPHAPVRRQSG